MVRDRQTVALLADGQATTGASTELTSTGDLVLAISPTIAGDVAFPARAVERWPAVPAVVGTAQDLSAQQSPRARTEPTAAD